MRQHIMPPSAMQAIDGLTNAQRDAISMRARTEPVTAREWAAITYRWHRLTRRSIAMMLADASFYRGLARTAHPQYRPHYIDLAKAALTYARGITDAIDRSKGTRRAA